MIRNGPIAGSLIALVAGANAAAQFDMAAIAKWKDAKVVHYQIVGVFRAATPLAPGKYAAHAFVEATDRMTVEFDWDVRANAVVGQAKFTNAPSQVASANSGKADCPARPHRRTPLLLRAVDRGNGRRARHVGVDGQTRMARREDVHPPPPGRAMNSARARARARLKK